MRYSIGVGVLMAGALVWFFGWQELGGRLAGARKVPLFGMSVLILSGFWLRALKWHWALGPGGQGIGVFFLAKMAGNWSPGRAGELAPLLFRRHRSAGVAAWILVDRVIEAVTTLFFGVLGLSALGWISLPAACGIVFVTGVAMLWTAQAVAGCRLPGSILSHRLSHWAHLLQIEFGKIGRKMPAIVLLTLVAKITDVVAVQWLCLAFGYDVSFLLVCAARCAHALVSAVPATPDATGVPYLAAAYVMNQYAGIPSSALAAALGLEVVVINLILALSFCIGLLTLRKETETTDL